MAAFRKKHPGIELILRSAVTIDQISAIMASTLDFGFVRAPDHFPIGIKGFIVATDGRAMQIQPPGIVLMLVGEKNRGVQCFFDERYKLRLGAIRRGETIKVAGRIETYRVGILYLHDCIFD